MNFLVGLLTGYVVFTDSGKNACNFIIKKTIDSVRANFKEKRKSSDEVDEQQ